MKYLSFILLLTILTIACSKENKTTTGAEIKNDDYLTFGTFNGECLGNDCVRIFVLEESKLFEDPNDLNGTLINYITLSNEKYDLVKDLIDYFPTNLFDEENQTFGCPDCVDQGGIYVRYSIDGNSGEFRIDMNNDKIPSYLHGFVDKIKEKLELL
jgi:hypothetical protein